MYFLKLSLFYALMCGIVQSIEVYETDTNFRIDPGTRTCFFEKGAAGQVMELFYQVIDGQHGDLDISVDVFDPNGVKLISDYKKSENAIILELENDGDYAFCMDNTFSVMNSKLVFMSVIIDDRKKGDEEAEVSVVGHDGEEKSDGEIVEWVGTTENGEEYRIDVRVIIESMIRMLNHIVKARHMLDLYSATKSRDSYLALEDTFIVDVWSGFQIVMMMIVGLIQVYTIKKLFTKQTKHSNVYQFSQTN